MDYRQLLKGLNPTPQPKVDLFPVKSSRYDCQQTATDKLLRSIKPTVIDFTPQKELKIVNFKPFKPLGQLPPTTIDYVLPKPIGLPEKTIPRLYDNTSSRIVTILKPNSSFCAYQELFYRGGICVSKGPISSIHPYHQNRIR